MEKSVPRPHTSSFAVTLIGWKPLAFAEKRVHFAPFHVHLLNPIFGIIRQMNHFEFVMAFYDEFWKQKRFVKLKQLEV